MMSTKKTLEESIQSLTEKRESVQKEEWARYICPLREVRSRKKPS